MSAKILIIEDSEDIRENIVELLKFGGYTVFSATNGKEGLEKAKSLKADLILCDILMPELDGYSVYRILKNIPEINRTPFVFLTSKSEKEDFRKGMDLGVDDYLVKPFDCDELLKIVGAKLKKNNSLKNKFSDNHEALNEFIDLTNVFNEITSLSDKGEIKKVKTKRLLFTEGDQPNFLYYIIKGRVKLFQTNEEGKEYITDIYKNGEFFGHTSLIEETTYKKSAIAIEDSEIALIPKEDFYQLLSTNKKVSLQILKLISTDISTCEDKLLKIAYSSARKRVAEALILILTKYQKEGENEYSFPAHRENISALAGISAESVSRNLTNFKDEGLIETKKEKIKIVDFRKLESLKN